MKRITRTGNSICFPSCYLDIYLKAKKRGWRTIWTGENMICMKKEKRT